jgi:AcrR family transcriptional regulator
VTTSTTRERILTEAMRLFGEKGYEATTIAEIEAAAGLTAGSGGLYRHFRSKADVLAAGVLQQIRTVADLIATVNDPEQLRQRPLRERLAILAEAGFRRLDAKRDLNRILHRRDLVAFPELLEALRDEDLRRVFQSVTHWFEAEAGDHAPRRDWQAIAAVLVGAIAHYWLLRDAIGGHPDDVGEDRYRAAWVEMALLLLSKQEVGDGKFDQAMTQDVREPE